MILFWRNIRFYSAKHFDLTIMSIIRNEVTFGYLPDKEEISSRTGEFIQTEVSVSVKKYHKVTQL